MRCLPLLLLCVAPLGADAGSALHRTALTLQPGAELATGNEWLALPDIRASDAALQSFNVLSMRNRGLLQVNGYAGGPVLEPYFRIDGRALRLQNPDWELIEYWIPQARQVMDGMTLTATWCAPPGYRAAFLRLTVTNHRETPVSLALGLKASFGALSRVTYTPVVLRGERQVAPAPWVDPGEAFSFITSDTGFSWAVVHPGAKALLLQPPASNAPGFDATRELVLAPGASTEAVFVLAAGIEEFSAAHNARALREMLDREGSDALLARTGAWLQARTRATGRADLDVLMNRNFLFTALYAWGRTLDTEQLVGVTSRSPRYYVSAAYWDRDAMLWSFPALLDIDRQLAREALDYALTTQLRNAGTHSRFIDGVVLEDGFQLDEAAAPLIAAGAYLAATHDTAFMAAHRAALETLRDRLIGRYDAATGLYSSLQDSQDEFQRLPFLTYDNVLCWRAFGELAGIFRGLGDARAVAAMTARAQQLRASILKHSLTTVDRAGGPIFASATDGSQAITTEIPPGSLMKLPALGFIAEDDPLFARTYDWLHSADHPYSYAGKPYGLPGSYRLPFTTSWMIADELLLQRAQARAEAILLASPWDAGIITEGIDPDSARADTAGRAFATAAGYVAHAICVRACSTPR